MAKQLSGLAWQPAWVSHMGVLKGCLDYLGIPISTAWLYGGTGHAFIINMDPTGCPSGPTAWHTEMLFNLGHNLGYTVNGIVATKAQPEFADKQRAAWELAKSAIDRGIPCYGWELMIPEFYVVNGYDDQGYLFSGPAANGAKGPKPWMELGQTEIGCLELYAVERGHTADDRAVVKEAVEFALEHATGPAKWIYPGYKAGLDAYDNWLHALQSSQASMVGLGYNAAVWSECRDQAVAFLDEAATRLGGAAAPLLLEAKSHYQVVAGQLNEMTKLYPFWPEPATNSAELQAKATAVLQAARQAEEKGLESLTKVVEALR